MILDPVILTIKAVEGESINPRGEKSLLEQVLLVEFHLLIPFSFLERVKSLRPRERERLLDPGFLYGRVSPPSLLNSWEEVLLSFQW